MISLEPTEITGQHVTHGGPGMMMRGTHDAMDMGDLSESSVDQSFDTDADGSVSNAELGAGLSVLLAQHDADGNVAHFPDEFATIFAQVMLGMAERPFTMLDVYANGDNSGDAMAFPAKVIARMRLMHVNDAATEAD